MAIATTGGYEINLNKVKKTIGIRFEGSASKEDVGRFINEYNQTVASIQASDYTLHIDCTDMKLVPKDMIPQLESAYQLYKDSGFKKVIFEIKENVVLKMQLNRIARNINLTSYEVVSV